MINIHLDLHSTAKPMLTEIFVLKEIRVKISGEKIHVYLELWSMTPVLQYRRGFFSRDKYFF